MPDTTVVDIITWVDGIAIGYFCGILTCLFIFYYFPRLTKPGE